MAVKIENRAIARRYASAFFALAKEQDKVEAVSADMRSTLEMIDVSEDFGILISNSTLRRRVQSNAIAAIADKAKFSGLSKKFLCMIAMNRRLGLLTDIIEAVQNEVAKYKGEITAQVIAAEELSDKQVAKIEQTLKKILNLNVKIEVKHDAGIIGGLVIQVGSQRIDGSVKAKLERLHRALKGSKTSSDKESVREVA